MAEELYPLAGKRIWVAGHRGMVGSALVRRLEREDCTVLTAGREEVDLLRQTAVEQWLAASRPDAVLVAAARVGGILANDTRPAEFLYENLAIETNIIHAAWRSGVEKLVFLGSSCIYPREAPQPLKEEALLSGPLEPTNEWYAIAKIAGIKMCAAYRRQYGCDFISAMPTNLYGPGDNFDPLHSHVLPALMAKIDTARREGRETVEIWGSGRPRREFLHVDDLADAVIFLLRCYSDEGHVNVGTGQDIAIGELAGLLADVIGYEGRFVYDDSKPDGMMRKLLDVSKITALGWQPRFGLREGVEDAYRWYLANRDRARGLAAGAGA